jgi:sugar phosphate isomerase/epimerase
VALDAIAGAGFRHAGIMTQKRELGSLVISVKTTPEQAAVVGDEARKRGLRILSVYGGGFPVEQSLEAGIRGLRRLIDNAAAARSATLMVGGTGSAGLYDPYYKAIAESCDYAREKHVEIVLKPHGGLNATGPQCRKAIERVGHESFRLWYDPGNILYYSEGKLDPVEDLRSVAGIVTGLCIKDFRMEERDGKRIREVVLTPGTGRVDFASVVRGLRAGGFRSGPVLIECLSRGPLPRILEEARKTRKLVEDLLEEAGSDDVLPAVPAGAATGGP